MKLLQRITENRAGLWLLFLVWALFISGLYLPRNWGWYGNGDWDLTYSTFEAARISMVQYGEWPSYQPFLAFGSDLDANPQAVHASVFFIPVLLAGTFYGYKISILLALLLGVWGGFRWFRQIGGDPLVSACTAIVFCSAPYFGRHIFEAGHSNFLHLYLLPWLLYHLYAFARNGKTFHALVSVFLLMHPISGGAPIVFLIMSAALLVFGLGLVLIEKNRPVLLMYFASFLMFSLVLAAWKLLPVSALWELSPRLVKDDSGISLLVWLQALCDLRTDTRTPHGWHELSMGFPLALLALGLYGMQNERTWKKWFLLLLPFLWIGLGNTPEYFNPWYALNRYVPVFSSLRAPYRIGIITLAALSSFFVVSSKFINNKQLLYIVLAFVTLSQSLGFSAISRLLVFTPYGLENSEAATELRPLVLKPDESQTQFVHLRRQHFVLNAYEPLALQPVQDSMTVFLEGGELLEFSPSHLRIRAGDGLLRICQRYSPYWVLSGKGKVVSDKGLLAVKDAAGDLELRYVNPAMKNGLKLSAAGLVLLTVCAVWHTRQRKKKAATSSTV